MERSWTNPRWAWAVLCTAAVLAGCAQGQLPRIDPSGERIFLPPAANPAASAPIYCDEPGGPLPSDDVGLTLTPAETVAPIDSEVILIAGVVGPGGSLGPNRRLEWSLDPSGVGHFVAVGRGTLYDWLIGDLTCPRIVDATSAVGITTRDYLRLNRGTPDPGDDVYVRRGQGWVSVSSPVEGTSYVSVFAPDVYPWPARQKSARIHWIDAEWTLPPTAIQAAGTSRVLTTCVTRHSDKTPCQGWIVRYRIASGPPAGFAPSGAEMVEAPTDASGRATAELFQKQASPGTTTVSVEIIRPAGLAGQSAAFVVGSGSTMVTWTAPSLGVRKTAPAAAAVGSTMVLRTEVANCGDMPADNVTVAETVPEGTSYVGSNPPATLSGNRLTWSLGTLAGGQRQTIEVTYRAEQPGSVTCCVEVAAAGGLTARDCATTTIAAGTAPSGATPPATSAGPIDVRIAGPSQVALGAEAAFQILVTNRSAQTYSGLIIKDRFEAGLEHQAARSPIERELGELRPGQSQSVEATFKAARAGRWCHQVEILDANGRLLGSAQACVTVVGTGAPGAGVPTPAPGEPGDTASDQRPNVTIRKTGPTEAAVGDTVLFDIAVTNAGRSRLSNLKVVDRYDAGLKATKATNGYRLEGRDLVWTIESLAAGESVRLAVECQCTLAAATTCNRASVVSDGVVVAQAEACLSIRAAPGGAVIPPGRVGPSEGAAGAGLSATIADVRDPVSVGRDVVYRIHVTNAGPGADSQVAVRVAVPVGMSVVPLGTFLPNAPSPTISGRLVQFAPVATIPPGETLVYEVRLKATQAGDYRVRAEVTSQGLASPLVVEETTEVLPPGV